MRGDLRGFENLGGLAAYPPSLNAYVYAFNDPISLSDPSGEFPVVAAALYAAGYVGYDQADSRVKSGVGRAVLDGIGFLTGYENIQQDWGVLTNCCTGGLCKVMAAVDMAWNATSGVSMFSGVGQGLQKYQRLAGQVFDAPPIGNARSIPVNIGRITTKEVSTKLTNRGIFRIPGSKTILAPTGFFQNNTRAMRHKLAHEVGHIFQEFGSAGKTLRVVQLGHRVSIKSSTGRGLALVLPVIYGYVLNPLELHAASAGLANGWNLAFLSANRSWLNLVSQSNTPGFGLDWWCER